MDSTKFSCIAHRDHLFYAPIQESKLQRILSHLTLRSEDGVIDIGSGSCEILIRIIEKFHTFGIGIDLVEEYRIRAYERANGRIPQDRLSFIVSDASEFLHQYNGSQFGLAVCTGATHAFGGYQPTLAKLRKLVKPGGYILVGEGFWEKSPEPEYLEALGGAGEDELLTHAENVLLAENLGLTCLWAATSSEDDWDEYEWLYSMSIENYVYENPTDPDAKAMLSKIRNWRRAYLKWGRQTLGFGLYLFRN